MEALENQIKRGMICLNPYYKDILLNSLYCPLTVKTSGFNEADVIKINKHRLSWERVLHSVGYLGSTV